MNEVKAKHFLNHKQKRIKEKYEKKWNEYIKTEMMKNFIKLKKEVLNNKIAEKTHGVIENERIKL